MDPLDVVSPHLLDPYMKMYTLNPRINGSMDIKDKNTFYLMISIIMELVLVIISRFGLTSTNVMEKLREVWWD